jgi:hypothetical protein
LATPGQISGVATAERVNSTVPAPIGPKFIRGAFRLAHAVRAFGFCAEGYDLVLATQAHHLTLLEARTQRLETGSSSLKGTDTDNFKFDGQHDQKTPRQQDAC